MNVFHVILWIAIILVLLGGLLLALIASRRPTAEKPGTYWLIVPVVALVVALGIFALAGGWSTLPANGFHIVVVVILVLIGIVGGSPLVHLVLKLSGNEGALGVHGGILVNEPGSKTKSQEILRGGATIGYLERLIFAVALIMGQFAAVAVVIAVKGLGRFSELGNFNAGRERFIIGTLVSFVWTAACIAPVAFIGAFIGDW